MFDKTFGKEELFFLLFLFCLGGVGCCCCFYLFISASQNTEAVKWINMVLVIGLHWCIEYCVRQIIIVLYL